MEAGWKCSVGCPILDGQLEGGVPWKSVTEVVGESGVGKTQLCLQVAVGVGMASGSCLYLHTEFPFPLRRLRQLAGDEALDRVFVEAVHTAEHLLGLMPRIHAFASSLSRSPAPLRLIVVDSIAALFRSHFDNSPPHLRARSHLFFRISSALKALAHTFSLAVLLTNQVVDLVHDQGLNAMRVGNFTSLFTSGRRVSPALGLAWSHCVNSRLFLSRDETRRSLHVVFAPHLPQLSCDFTITRQGLFGLHT